MRAQRWPRPTEFLQTGLSLDRRLFGVRDGVCHNQHPVETSVGGLNVVYTVGEHCELRVGEQLNEAQPVALDRGTNDEPFCLSR